MARSVEAVILEHIREQPGELCAGDVVNQLRTGVPPPYHDSIDRDCRGVLNRLLLENKIEMANNGTLSVTISSPT